MPRALVICGIVSETSGEIELDPHHHAKSKTSWFSATLSCKMHNGLWIVPHRSAIWTLAGTDHFMKVTGAIGGYAGFIAINIGALPLPYCRVHATMSLLRERLMQCAALPLPYVEARSNRWVTAVLIDDRAATGAEDLHLPMSTDPRLRRVVEGIMQRPADRGTPVARADRAGMSRRTIERVIRRETGSSSRRWPRQLAPMRMVKRVDPSSRLGLGYDNTANFVPCSARRSSAATTLHDRAPC